MKLIVALIPVPVGVALATMTDVKVTPKALIVAVWAVVVSAARTVTYKQEAEASSCRPRSLLDIPSKDLPSVENASGKFVKTAPSASGVIQDISLLLTVSSIWMTLLLFMESGNDSASETSQSLVIIFRWMASFLTHEYIVIPKKVWYLILGSTFHYAHTCLGFIILSRCSSLSFALSNVVKRLLTIIYTMYAYHIEWVFSNMGGIILANFGVWLYVIERARLDNLSLDTPLAKSSEPRSHRMALSVSKTKNILVVTVLMSLLGTVVWPNLLEAEHVLHCPTESQIGVYVQDIVGVVGSSNIILIGLSLGKYF